MNMWACPAGFIDKLEERFVEFLGKHGSELKAEFLLPEGIDYMIKNGIADCEVLESRDKWFGVTYAEDKPSVISAIAKLIEEGKYPAKLWK